MKWSVLEVRECGFTGSDGEFNRGFYVYLLNSAEARRVYVDRDKSFNMAYFPEKGDEVIVFWDDEDNKTVVDFIKC